MAYNSAMKSSVEEIQQRFDSDVERFSNLETGQSAVVDAPLALELITQAAAATTPQAKSLLDIGCGAGNYSLRMLGEIPNLNCTLVDLSRPMLERAVQRVTAQTSGMVTAMQGDIRELALGAGQYDIILAAAVLHHLREESEWRTVYAELYAALTPGGSLWVSDLVVENSAAVHAIMWKRYGQYLASLKNEEYRDSVFAYIEKEDTPRSLLFQIEMMREVGFREIDILHKNSVFASFGGRKLAE